MKRVAYYKGCLASLSAKELDSSTQALELGFLLELAACMVVAGIERKESRGAHARPHDYPDRDDEQYLKHTLVTMEDGRPQLDWKPVTMTKWQPQERTY
jgi:succinate dehydrogenase / fumarate reductase, flavoprotein subunit